LVWELEEGRERVLRFPEKTMKMASNLIIYGTWEDKMLFHLSLIKMAELRDPIATCYMMISLDLKPMRAHPKLLERNLKGMHRVPNHTWGLNNKVVP